MLRKLCIPKIYQNLSLVESMFRETGMPERIALLFNFSINIFPDDYPGYF